MIVDGRTPNFILNAMPRRALAELWPNLDRVELKRGTTLHRRGYTVRRIYFVEQGLISLVRSMKDGKTVEVPVSGKLGVTTPEVLLGCETALLDGVVQLPGSALFIETDALQRFLSSNNEARSLIQSHLHLVLDRLAQSAACNRLHSLYERCCRWLLIAHDAAGTDSFPLTHEFLAQMLGTQRPGVTTALNELEQVGHVRHQRGELTVTDRPALESGACECYGKLRAKTGLPATTSNQMHEMSKTLIGGTDCNFRRRQRVSSRSTEGRKTVQYRTKAEALRAIAEDVATQDAVTTLLDLAESYDELADRIRKRPRLRDLGHAT